MSRPNPHRRRHWVLSAAAALVVATVGVRPVRSKKKVPVTRLVAVPLTSYPGNESSPSFSPDGTQVAFAWDGEKQDNSDIYVKQIGVEPPYRLTNHPAMDYSPAWSPDGRSIAFLARSRQAKPPSCSDRSAAGPNAFWRRSTGQCPPSLWPVLILDPGLKVAPRYNFHTRTTGWGLALVSAETGEQRPLTNPPTEEIGDMAPAILPDGRTLLFSRVSPDYNNVTLWLLGLGEGYKPLDREEKVKT